MAQRSQIIDITKSYLPGDPNAFVHNLVNTDKEDGEEKSLPPLMFEGYNFIPTSYGYRSYFGTIPKLDILTLASRVQFVYSYQLPDFSFRLIALAEDGIWTANPGTIDGAWTHDVTIGYTSTVLEEWSTCIIENVLYMYHQADSVVYKTLLTLGVLSIGNFTPSFLNMAGQMGIFKAGTRLGFWDSANSTAWGSNIDLTDFTPSIENYAGNQVFEAVVGRIVTVRGHGEGFVIYCTKSIVGANFNQQGILLWDAKKVFDAVGITHSRAVTHGQSEAEHIVYTTAGIYVIGGFDALAGSNKTELIIADVYDFLKETRDPVWLDTINSRYVFFHILNPEYVFGQTIFSYESIAPLILSVGGNPWDGKNLPAIDIDGNAAANAIRQMVTFGFEGQPLDTNALWTSILTETQDNTIGPLSTTGSRNAQALGFTVADLNSSYLTGTTLPGELTPIPEEHTDLTTQYLGTLPQYAVTVENAAGISLIKVIQKQMNDWKLFNMHQQAAVTALGAASLVVPTPGVSEYRTASVVTPPFAAPADATAYNDLGDFNAGHGNMELQKDVPGRRLVLRKYWQQKINIKRKKVTSYAWRQQGSIISGGLYAFWTGTTNLSNTAGMTPGTQSVTFPAITGNTLADARLAMEAFLVPPNVAASSSSGAYIRSTCTVWSAGNELLNVYYYKLGDPGDEAPYNVVLSYTQQDAYSWYLDVTETYTYEVTLSSADMGHTDFQATMIAYGRSYIQVTSSPPTVVVDSTIPIFPTGPAALTFFPPAWAGVETLKIIAASALSPWHYLEGTFGIELLGDPLTGADAAADEGGYVAYGSGSIGGAFDVTYSSSSYLMQTGAFSLLYPTFEGSLVLDLHLKKWGKMKNRFTCLIDLNPVNQTTPDLFAASDMGMTAGLKMTIDDTIRVFDENPEDSVARYGKIGHYRLGMTNALETKTEFRSPCTGVLSIDASMDGRTIDPSRTYSVTYTNTHIAEALPDLAARWFIVSISGKYDLTGLEFRSKVVSRR